MSNKEAHEQLDETGDSGSMPAERNNDEALDKHRIVRAQVELLRLLARECATRVARPDN